MNNSLTPFPYSRVDLCRKRSLSSVHNNRVNVILKFAYCCQIINFIYLSPIFWRNSNLWDDLELGCVLKTKPPVSSKSKSINREVIWGFYLIWFILTFKVILFRRACKKMDLIEGIKVLQCSNPDIRCCISDIKAYHGA